MRGICDTYTDRGLPNYPSGVPFTFWEQYIKLRLYLALSILCILLVTFIVLTIMLMNPWLASIIVSSILKNTFIKFIFCLSSNIYGFLAFSSCLNLFYRWFIHFEYIINPSHLLVVKCLK